jgi:hypothetical protein
LVDPVVAIAGFTPAAVLTDTAASGWLGCAAPVGCTEGDEPANRLLAAIRISEMILHTASNAIFEASRSTPDKQEWDRKEPCVGAVLLGGHPPHGVKPQLQRGARILKNSSGCHRGLVSTADAL